MPLVDCHLESTLLFYNALVPSPVNMTQQGTRGSKGKHANFAAVRLDFISAVL